MPYQVPPETAHFVDREEEQARAFRAVAGWDGQSRPLCLALSGLGGTGKTELAFRIVRAVRDRYPDGVLYVDLDELRRDGAVEVSDALGDLLRSLDVSPEWLGHTFKARCRQYWERTDGKRLVVVVDNARYGSEVVPLLPASGAGLVVVTSHGPLYDLESGAVTELELAPLDDPHARELLRRLVDDPRLDAEPEAAAGLIGLCSGLPAALHVAGRWIRRHRRRPLARLLTDLTAELNDKGLPMVERVWDAAYRTLGPHAALLYRLLSAAPGASLTPDAATALLGRGHDAADDALEELENAGLLDTRSARVRLPDLLRAHAARCAARHGDEAEAAEGARRIVRWYLRQAQRADAVAAGTRLTLAPPVPPLPGTSDVPFATPAGALGWLEDERHALFACVRTAHALGLDTEAWSLCEPLWTHYLDHPHPADVTDAFRTAVHAAQRTEDTRALIRMRCQLARPLWEQARFDEARHEMTQARTAAASLGHSPGERKLAASVREFTGSLHAAQGDWARAATEFEASLRVHREIGNTYGAMLQTYRLGQAVAEVGDLQRAAELLESAHAQARELGRARMTARTGFALGTALHRLGRHDAARDLYEAALTGARDRAAEHEEARVLTALATLADDTGHQEEAHRHRTAAQAIRERNGGLT
ncbi:hypothetical protein N4P33_12830 [Streptomyces sp. 15-116A]|uniref:tetratricopeptide repeat protein n=1 Tax=Streptomyces sp. 15-116A TaxID=2259035 RepID=UPI0021B1933E|nr:tetratricopeptide repeat protein [Streptomyces sp. 15-116A]MCT7353052.1 hypothetical protein [Streptomyces sp. 15-116A]